jgi:Zn-dependent M28 family amino/carboxypeptidase
MLALFLAATISAASFKAHIDFLASDLLEGRETGSHGFDVAAQYVATQFAGAGLDPAGDNGTYFQRIEFTTAQVDEAKSSFVLDGKKLVMRKDVVFAPVFTSETAAVEAPVVFAGFGGEADYANIDVRDKIVLLLTGAPPQLPSDERAYFSDGDVKRKTAASHGAIGILSLKTITDEKRRSFAKGAAQASMKTMRAKGDAGEPALRALISISRETAAKMFRGKLDAVLDDAEKGITHPFALGVRVKIRTVSKFGSAMSENVVARLKGASDENVVVSAHLDHLGLMEDRRPRLSGQAGAPVLQPDRIFNGALDNASGDAALIEIARAFAELPQRPARSVVFIAVTGEEKGELGSEYFAKHSTVSPIVADINMDMFTMLFPVKDIIALGAEHTTLGDLAADAAKQAGFELSPDPQPEEVRFIRSDQYSFVQQGIPAMIFKAGIKSSDPSIDGEKVTREWLREVYHSVKDNPDQKLDYASGARWADANFRLALAVANAPERPAWKKGDFFGQRFGK